MLERRRTLILEVRDGLAAPESIALEEGREVEPLGVGTDGAWRVEGEGVLPVHAFFCFDGRALFVQSADLTRPALVDGRAAPADWTEVTPPATITVGRVAIVFRSLSDDFDDETQADPPPPAAGKPARPFAPGAFAPRPSGPDSEQTRLQAGPRAPMAPAMPQRPLPAAGRPATSDAPRAPSGRPSRPDAPIFERRLDDEPTRIEQPLASRTPARSAPRAAPTPGPAEPAVVIAPPVAPGSHVAPGAARAPMASKPIDLPPPPPPAAPPSKPTGLAWALGEWRGASGPKKALVCLMPFAIAAVFIIFRDEPPPPASRSKPKPVAAASATPSASATTASVPAARPAPVAPIVTVDGGPTLERIAIDAVASGAYADAIRAYEQLAASYPDRTAYAEAARILRARVDAGR